MQAAKIHEGPMIGQSNIHKTPKKLIPQAKKSPLKSNIQAADSVFKSIIPDDEEIRSPIKTPIKNFDKAADEIQDTTTPKKKKQTKGSEGKNVSEVKLSNPTVLKINRNLSKDSNFERLVPGKDKSPTQSGSIKVLASQKASKEKEPKTGEKGQREEESIFNKNIEFKSMYIGKKQAEDDEVDEDWSMLEYGSGEQRKSESQQGHMGSDGSGNNSNNHQETTQMSPFTPALAAGLKASVLDLTTPNRRYGMSLRGLPEENPRLRWFQRQIKMLQFMLEENGTFLKSWATANTVVLICVGIFTPIRAGIMKDEQTDFLYFIEKATDGFFLFDILVNFATPVYVNGDRVADFGGIAKQYIFSRWFVVDFLSIIPLDELFSWWGFPARWIVYSRLVRGFKLIRLFKIFKPKDSDEIGSDNFAVQALWNLVGSHVQFTMFIWSLWMVLIFHTLACYWYWLGKFNDGKSWGYVNGFSENSDLDFYIAAVYFIMQTFTSTGYGDLQSKNNVEIATRVFMMVFGVIVYSLFTGKLSQEVGNIVEVREEIGKKLQRLEELSELYELDIITVYRLRGSILARLDKNYEYTGQNHNFDLKIVFSHGTKEQSDPQIYEYCTYQYGKLSKMPMFKALPTNTPIDELQRYQSYMAKLFHSMKHRKYEAGEIIYMKGDSARTFYIIQSGEVAFTEMIFGEEFAFSKVGIRNPDFKHKSSQISPFQQSQQISLQTSTNELINRAAQSYIQGGYFGELELLAEGIDKREFTVRALKKSVIYMIDVDAYLQIFFDRNSDEELARATEQKARSRMQKIAKNLNQFRQQTRDILKDKLEAKLMNGKHSMTDQSVNQGCQQDSKSELKDYASEKISKIMNNLEPWIFSNMLEQPLKKRVDFSLSPVNAEPPSNIGPIFAPEAQTFSIITPVVRKIKNRLLAIRALAGMNQIYS
jgi:CRP-like cAMP-binding protein